MEGCARGSPDESCEESVEQDPKLFGLLHGALGSLIRRRYPVDECAGRGSAALCKSKAAAANTDCQVVNTARLSRRVGIA